MEEVCGVVQQAAADEQARLAGAAVALRREVWELLRDGMTVMSLSLSSTILGAVREAAGKPRAGLRGLHALEEIQLLAARGGPASLYVCQRIAAQLLTLPPLQTPLPATHVAALAPIQPNPTARRMQRVGSN